MISLRKFNTATKFLFLLAPILLVSGCSTVSHSPTATSKAAALVKAEPGPDRLLRYCQRMADTNNLRIAVGVCKRALEAAPENPEPVLILANAYLAVQRDNEAVDAFRFALTLDPTNSDAHYGLGKLYLKQSQLADAEAHLEAALSISANDPAIYNALGILKDQQGDHATAQNLYRSGLEINPENTALSNNLGVSLLLSERLSEGASVLGSLNSHSRPNETRRQNLAAAQEAIAAIDLSSPRQAAALRNSERTISSPLQNVRTVSARDEEKSRLDLQKHSATAPVKPTKVAAEKVKARPAAPPSSTLSAAIITAVPTQPQANLRSNAVVLDSLEGTGALGLDPVITPAPVAVVDFQTLPPLPKQSVEIERPNPVPHRQITIVAEALPELPNDQAAPEMTVTLDLATISPRRKPLVLAATKAETTNQENRTLSAESKVETKTEILVTDIPHLPIEGMGDENGTANGSEPHFGRDQHAEEQSPIVELAQISTPAIELSAWGNESLPGDELTFGLEPLSPSPSDDEGQRFSSQKMLADVGEGETEAPSPVMAEATEAVVPLPLKLARYHQGGDAGLDDQPGTDTTHDSEAPAELSWPLDLASLPESADHGDQPQQGDRSGEEDAPYEPDLPLLDWPSLVAIREVPPSPTPEPRGDRLLSLMMIHRETLSSA